MAIDWKAPMTRRARYYEMDPATWCDVAELDDVEGCSVVWDLSLPTLGNASFSTTRRDREMWIRCYVHAEQDGEVEEVADGTWLVPPADVDWNGSRARSQADGYTSLKELDDDGPAFGWSVAAGEDALAAAAEICAAHCRAPVVPPASQAVLAEAFCAGDGMTWLTYVRELLAKVSHEVMVDGYGRITFEPTRDAAALSPVLWLEVAEDSIMAPSVKDSDGARDVPNVVRVVYSDASRCLVGEAIDDDPASPSSTVSRGRTVLYREESPALPDDPTQEDVDELAARLLAEKGAAGHTVTVPHGYYPDARIGRGVGIDVPGAGISARAKVTAQQYDMTPGLVVTAQLTYSRNMRS